MAKFITVTISDQKLQLAISRFGTRLRDFRRFWTEFFAPQFFADVQRNLASEGGYVGGWRALSPRYAAWKLRTYGPRPMMVLTGRLKNSFVLGASENVVRARPLDVYVGSRVPYVPYHQRGTDRMPQRKIIWLGPNQTYKRLLSRFVAEEASASGIATRVRA